MCTYWPHLWLVAVTWTILLIGSEVGKVQTEWPAYVDGQYVVKRFRFPPASVEYRALPTRRPSVLVVFAIKQKEIPADTFAIHLPDETIPSAKDRIEKLLRADDGHMTVEAYWVNPPVPKEKWQGAPERWLEGRVLLGKLVEKPTKEPMKGKQ